MPGFLDNNLPILGKFSGSEQANLDTEFASGGSPQSAALQLQQLAAALLMLGNNQDVTGIANQRFSVSFPIGALSVPVAPVSQVTQRITGIELLVGTTGGTDLWIVELHDSTGALVANSALAGTTAGTANIWQKIPFTAAYDAAPGLYFLTLIMNGTTAKFRAYNSPGLNLLTQSASGGTFGTNAAITPPTTYTVAVGPVAVPYF